MINENQQLNLKYSYLSNTINEVFIFYNLKFEIYIMNTTYKYKQIIQLK